MQVFMLLSNPLHREFCLQHFSLVGPCCTHSASDHSPYLQISENHDVVKESLLHFYTLVRPG